MITYTILMTVEIDEEYVRDADIGYLALEKPPAFVKERIEYDNYDNPTGYEVTAMTIQREGTQAE